MVTLQVTLYYIWNNNNVQFPWELLNSQEGPFCGRPEAYKFASVRPW